jgi:eukaryotic-like serine/threonine-protein kinase
MKPTQKKRGLISWLRSGKTASPSGPSGMFSITDMEGRDLKRPMSERIVHRGEIARGGMGSVHDVFDPNLQRHMAMKLLFPEHQSDPLTIQRFAEEAQITGQLDHPNIVPVHDFAADKDDTRFIIMKLVRGKTLTQLLRAGDYERGSRDAYFQFLPIYSKVCDAVAFAHSRGVIHRDLKPDNIMVGSFGQVYLMDWGIARLLGRAHPSQDGEVIEPVAVHREPGTGDTDAQGQVIGTFYYMAPEQAHGQLDSIDERTDVFLLGAVLYEILTGVPPFLAPSTLEVVRKAQACEPPPPEVIVPSLNVPLPLSRICMKALSRDPSERYQSVIDLKNDIEHFLRGGASFPTTTFAPGALLMQEGDVGNEVFVIDKGNVLAFKTGRDGRRQELARLGPGSVVGEAGVLSSQPRTASVIALDEVVATAVTREQLEKELGLDSWMGALVKALANRFLDLDGRLDKASSGLHTLHITNAVLQHILLRGAEGDSGQREASYSQLITALRGQFDEAEAELRRIIDSTKSFTILPARDAIFFLPARSLQPN